jgi:hypothetical protein
MNSIYVVIENGIPYETVYVTFASANTAVKEKYASEIAEQRKESGTCSDIDTLEDIVTAKTYMYVEKGIHIYIYKLPIFRANTL